jgi:transmembrane sensor
VSEELIEQQASRWLAARDAGGSDAARDAEFERWLEADIRHRVAYLRLEACWRRGDRLRGLRPLEGGVNADLLRPPRRHWTLAIAASVLALVAAGAFLAHSQFAWQRFETRVGGFSRIVLDDGSVVDLNTDSDVRVRIRSGAREVRLLRGEGRFQVAHDPGRPFTVSAADADVRAVGTAFTVRLHESKRVDVTVSEGIVAIEAARLHAPPVHAGEAAVVLPDRVSVRRLEQQQIDRHLSWISGRLQFGGDSLGEAVAEFNRYNRRQLKLADAGLARLRVGGTFNATDPESFAAALNSAFNLRVDAGNPDSIVLRPP